MALTQVQPAMLGTPQPYNFKNRIFNGQMQIDQRNAGASITANDYSFGVDRWSYYAYQNGKGTIQQNQGSVTPPAGFVNYLGFTSSSAYSVPSGEAFLFNQRIEGYNIADLGWGTANAKTVTLSFWVYSSLTGTFGGAIRNSAGTRSYPYSYSVPVANTWTQISVTIAGDTTGTWLTTNGIGAYVTFGLGVGSTFSGTAGSWAGANYWSTTGATSVVGTNGATFYITGVQLEVGVSATGFDYRPYGTELALCQRYFTSYGAGSLFPATQNGTTGVLAFVTTPVTLRTTPTMTIGAGSSYCVRQTTPTASSSTTITSIVFYNPNIVQFNLTGFTGLTDLYVCQLYTGGLLSVSAEL